MNKFKFKCIDKGCYKVYVRDKTNNQCWYIGGVVRSDGPHYWVVIGGGKVSQIRQEAAEKLLDGAKSAKLLPCPWCGEKFDLVAMHYSIDGNQIICRNCKAEGPVVDRPIPGVIPWNSIERREKNGE